MIDEELADRLRAHAAHEIAVGEPFRPDAALVRVPVAHRRGRRPLVLAGAVAAGAVVAALAITRADDGGSTTTVAGPAASATVTHAAVMFETSPRTLAASASATLTVTFTNALPVEATFPGALVVSRSTDGVREPVGYLLLTEPGFHAASAPFVLPQPGVHLAPGETHVVDVPVRDLAPGDYVVSGEVTDGGGAARSVEAVVTVTSG
jgi:hypothetical protein